MKWTGRRQSSNVEDRRGMKGGSKVVAGGGIIGIIILLITMFGGEQGKQVGDMAKQFGINSQEKQTEERPLTAEEKKMGEFVATVFADNEDTWKKIFAENGLEYEFPKMVLFTSGVETGCGSASSAMGPFYCPADKKVYMDLAFFEELRTRFGAKGGDFAIAYVIAHEVGHHIQTLLGTSSQVNQLQEGKSEAESNRLSVCQELQADFYAGVWAHHNKQYLEEGDIEEALSAANAVGDDAIQKRTQGRVNQESFTHGSSEQRKKWFRLGFSGGDVFDGNTYKVEGYRVKSF